MTDVITDVGLTQALANNFIGGDELAGKFGYMALGISPTAPTKDSTELNDECNPAVHVGYARVQVTATFHPEYNSVTLEAVFPEENISTTAEIQEIGISDSETDGNFYCIGQVTPMTKRDGIQLIVALEISMEQITEE